MPPTAGPKLPAPLAGRPGPLTGRLLAQAVEAALTCPYLHLHGVGCTHRPRQPALDLLSRPEIGRSHLGVLARYDDLPPDLLDALVSHRAFDRSLISRVVFGLRRSCPELRPAGVAVLERSCPPAALLWKLTAHHPPSLDHLTIAATGLDGLHPETVQVAAGLAAGWVGDSAGLLVVAAELTRRR